MMLQNRWVPPEPLEVDVLLEGAAEDPTQLTADREMEEKIAQAKETCRQRRIVTYIALVVYFFIFLYIWRKYHLHHDDDDGNSNNNQKPSST
jgi:hypothetical protein